MSLNVMVSKSLYFAQSIAASYEGVIVSRIMHPEDDMAHLSWDRELKHYFGVGLEALEIIIQAIVLTETTSINTILDMPCGFGRVARHLRAAFPNAELHCCDLYQDRVDFCRDTLGVIGTKSKEDYDQIQFEKQFDLIFVGSLLTHMPEPLFRKALALFSRSLAPKGIAVVTTQGRHAPYIQKHLWKFHHDAHFATAERGFRKRGFGYVDYNRKKQFFAQESYGVTLSSPAYVMGCLEADPTIRIQGMLERRWDKCQDVVIFKKIGIHSDER